MSRPEAVEPIRELLEDPLTRVILDAAGPALCHLVGGAIRDRLALGKPTDDWDLIVLDNGEAVAERLARRLDGRFVRLGGKRFTAYRVVSGTRVIDLWDRQGAPIELELRRRDLTINSIAMNLATGEIVDPLDGRADLEARILRANAPERFTEDPLRTLRLLRFSQHLPGFRIDPGTVIAARSGAPLLKRIAAERVRQELDLTLGRRLAADLGELLLTLDLFPRLWASESGAAPQRQDLDVLAEADRRLEELVGTSAEPLRATELAALNHAVLLLAAGAGESSSGTALRLERLVSRRWLTRSTADLIARILRPDLLPVSEADRRLFLHHHGTAWPLVATIVSLRAFPDSGSHEALAALGELAVRQGDEILQAKPLLDGHDLERFYDIEPGPRMGTLLRALGEAQATGSVLTVSQARRWVEEQLSRSSDKRAT